MCHDFSTPYCFLHKTRTMLVFATNYAFNKCVMVVLHFIGGFVVVNCRELLLCSSLQLIMSVPKCVMIVLHLTVSCKELWLCSSLQLISLYQNVSWWLNTSVFLVTENPIQRSNLVYSKACHDCFNLIDSCR